MAAMRRREAVRAVRSSLSSSSLSQLIPPWSRERLGLLLGFVGMAIFGGTLPATRIAVSAIDPLALTALRTAIAGLCSLALLIVLRRPLPPRRLWFPLAVAMLCVSVLFPFLMALAVQTVDASHGGVVLGSCRSPPPWSRSSSPMSGRSRCSGSLRWLGAALVIAFALRQGGGTLSAGDLLLFAAVAVSAIGYAFSGRLTAEMPGWEVISWVLVIALPISLPVAASPCRRISAISRLRPWLALLYVALFSQWIGFFAWNAGMAMGGIARVSQVQLLQPFVTFALAAHSTARPSPRRSCCSPRPWSRPSRSRPAPGATRRPCPSREDAPAGGPLTPATGAECPVSARPASQHGFQLSDLSNARYGRLSRIGQRRIFRNQFGPAPFRLDRANQYACGLHVIHRHT